MHAWGGAGVYHATRGSALLCASASLTAAVLLLLHNHVFVLVFSLLCLLGITHVLCIALSQSPHPPCTPPPPHLKAEVLAGLCKMMSSPPPRMAG